MSGISIVIPARNEATIIESSLARLNKWRECGHEIIVVDGDSGDATAALAQPYCDHVVHCESGRARQMNAGAAVARGNLLLFLHADSRLPITAMTDLTAYARSGVEMWGRFDVTLDAPGVAFRVIEFMMNLRSRLSGIATGDQAIFVTRGLFFRIGGFPPLALMEDIALSTRLRRLQLPVCLQSRITCSARRWRDHGILATVVEMWVLRLAYFLGVSPERLGAVYERRDARKQ